MKYRRLAVLAFASALCVARAQDEERQRPQIEIPDFSNLDEYIYEPRSTVRLGFRHLSGAKTQFFGTGNIFAPETALPDPSLTNVPRAYHDGSVLPDARSAPRVDASGNPMIDPQTNVQLTDPIPPDGKTNSWSFIDARQVTDAPLGFIQFHQYSAQILNTGPRDAQEKSTSGLDLTVSHDMGKLFGGRISWNLMAGMSVNDISAKKTDRVDALVKEVTDTYSTFGQSVPTENLPYQAPSTTTQTVTDAQGNPTTIILDNSVLISSAPVNHFENTVTDLNAAIASWKLKGAYYTFRAGPELLFPITSRLRASVSVGVAILYAGTNYTVTQTLTPKIGAEITEVDTDSAYKLLPGLYADASLLFDLTEKAGLFAGAVYQTASSYTQELHTTTSQYATKVDFSNQNGFRAGMSIRF